MAKSDIDKLQKAYREAGHITMYYLLDKGIASKYVPVDRSEMLVRIKRISLTHNGTDWEKISGNLGSIVIAAQLLMAGRAAEYKYVTRLDNQPENPESIGENLMSRAVMNLDVYLEEYMPHNASPSEVTKYAEAWGKKLYNYVQGQINTHWKKVKQIATQLHESESLSKKQVYEILNL